MIPPTIFPKAEPPKAAKNIVPIPAVAAPISASATAVPTTLPTEEPIISASVSHFINLFAAILPKYEPTAPTNALVKSSISIFAKLFVVSSATVDTYAILYVTVKSANSPKNVPSIPIKSEILSFFAKYAEIANEATAPFRLSNPSFEVSKFLLSPYTA